MFSWGKSDFFKGKKVLIFGLGLLGGGLGTAKFFAEAGSKVTVTDLKTEKELEPTLEKLKKFKIRYRLGYHDEKDFLTHDLIVKNPAIPSSSPYLKIAQEAKIPVEMEASLFFLLAPSKKIIGITGTKGKTTTALLIEKILSEAKYQIVTAGIPGKSILEQLKIVAPKTWVVLELSSWQLESLLPHKISPHIGVLTNIFPDHLNRYKSFEDYLAAKKTIFEFQDKRDFFVTNKELKITRKLAKRAISKVIFFSKTTLPKNIATRIKLLGTHNLLNVAAAFQVAKIFQISDEKLIKVLESFSPIPNHLEIVRKLRDVTFVNDTTATVPAASIAAISTFSRPTILLAGGADKNLDFAEFGKIINQKVKAVVLLEGTATDKIEREVLREKILGRFSNFQKAIEQAFKFAKTGDVVLLSPATASFGMFKNEFDRGEQFKKIVRELEARG